MELLPRSALLRCGIGPETRVLLALSGGADSAALLLLLSDAEKDGRIGALTAAHYHHGLRAAADDDAAFCRTLCGSMDIPILFGRGDVRAEAERTGESIEAAARRCRYAFLKSAKDSLQYDCIVTAHHADDQAETVLLHLLRGSGGKGLCGMQPRSGDLARPLLGVTHEMLLRFLEERGQAYCTDETNADLRYTRNRIREELLPAMEDYNPRVREAVCAMAELLSEDEAYLSEQAEELLRAAAKEDCYLRQVLLTGARPVRMRALLLLLQTHCGADYRRTDAEKLDALLTAQAGRSTELRDGYSAWNDGAVLRIGKREAHPAYCIPVEWEGDRFCCRADGWRVSGERAAAYRAPKTAMEACLCLDAFSAGLYGLQLRSKRDGDRFRPLGCKGTKLVSDIYADRKYAERLRRAPLLFCGEDLLFVPGYTVAEAARVTETSKTLIYFKVEEDEGV